MKRKGFIPEKALPLQIGLLVLLWEVEGVIDE